MSGATYPISYFKYNQTSMDDDAEEEFSLGDAAVIPLGHNAWAVGKESVMDISFTGLKEYVQSEGGLL
jgi:hypothetical protein